MRAVVGRRALGPRPERYVPRVRTLTGKTAVLTGAAGGIGRALVERCLDEARGLRLRKVFALTYQPEFFSHMGFRPVDKSELPHKVWRDCIQCTKFPDCDEVAVLKDLEEQE